MSVRNCKSCLADRGCVCDRRFIKRTDAHTDVRVAVRYAVRMIEH